MVREGARGRNSALQRLGFEKEFDELSCFVNSRRVRGWTMGDMDAPLKYPFILSWSEDYEGNLELRVREGYF